MTANSPGSVGWRPRAIAIDIDGTLLDRDQHISPGLKDAVRRATAEVPVMLATGRSWHATLPVAEELQLPEGIVVCSNGARTLRYPSGEILDERTFDASKVIKTVREHAPNALMAVEEHGVGHRVTGLFPDGDLIGEIRVVEHEDLAPEPVTRLIIRDPDSTDADFVELANRLGLHGVSYFVGWTAWLDIAPEGVDKSTGLKVALTELGLAPEDLLALGDGRNDIEMLQFAGRGVAMADAPAEVLAAANDIAKPVHEDGAALEISRWF